MFASVEFYLASLNRVYTTPLITHIAPYSDMTQEQINECLLNNVIDKIEFI